MPTGDALGAWPEVCEQAALRLLALAEQVRPAMNDLEDQEEDPDRLRLLFQVDHAVARMRRVAGDLRILAGRESQELAGQLASLVDVIRLAQSAIEHYPRIVIGSVAELAIAAYAADDVAHLLAALLDNATRYSRATVRIGAHLLDGGGVLMRIEDTGLGIAPDRLASINQMLAGPVPAPDPGVARHTGLPVVHRLAHRHGIGVQLACRPPTAGASGGTVAMVTLPPHLLREIPTAPATVSAAGSGAAALTRPADRPAWGRTLVNDQLPAPATADALPVRERTSLRNSTVPQPPGPVRAAPSPQHSAQVRHAFAEEVTAFDAGAASADRTGGRSSTPTAPHDPLDGPEGPHSSDGSEGPLAR